MQNASSVGLFVFLASVGGFNGVVSEQRGEDFPCRSMRVYKTSGYGCLRKVFGNESLKTHISGSNTVLEVVNST